MNDELFVVLCDSSQVNTYNTNTFTLSRCLLITGVSHLWAISSCSHCNCLYIGNTGLMLVHRYNLTNNVIAHWDVKEMCRGLSLTTTYIVLVTLGDNRQIQEYTTDGSLIREISLDKQHRVSTSQCSTVQ